MPREGDWAVGKTVLQAQIKQLSEKRIHKCLLAPKKRSAESMAAFFVDADDVLGVFLFDGTFLEALHHGSQIFVVGEEVAPFLAALFHHLLIVTVSLAGGQVVVEVFGFDVLLVDFLSDFPASVVIRPELLAVMVDLEGGDPAFEGRGWWLG